MTLKKISPVLAMICLLAAVSMAQQAKGKQHTLKGKVTEVSKDRLTVKHDAIPGFMGAMTMPYKVDRPEVLAKVKKDDQIEATVYEDDYTLYNVKVVPQYVDTKPDYSKARPVEPAKK